MKRYIFWNNKGGTGKTSLAFQATTIFAERNPSEKILVIDLCPQANLSEMLLGGLIGSGSANLTSLHNQNPRRSIAGYFQSRLPSPFTVPAINPADYISNASAHNSNIPSNIDLVAGDALVELQTNAISTLANTQIPGTNTWLAVIDWLNDFIRLVSNNYSYVFIDANPSFSIYTQIAIAAAELMILPVMADDSSRRAVQNAFALVQGINLPSPLYQQHNFATQIRAAGRNTPLFHLFVKNRLTQYMGPASAYQSVLTSIDGIISSVLTTNPNVFSFRSLSDGIEEVRDFQTTGVVAFALGSPFTRLRGGDHNLSGQRVQIRADYLQNCVDALNRVVNHL